MSGEIFIALHLGSYQGVCSTTIHGVQVRYTNLAHTVAECVVFRNRMGVSNMLSVLMTYLQDARYSQKDLQEACRFHRVEKAIQPYMETCLHLLEK